MCLLHIDLKQNLSLTLSSCVHKHHNRSIYIFNYARQIKQLEEDINWINRLMKTLWKHSNSHQGTRHEQMSAVSIWQPHPAEKSFYLQVHGRKGREDEVGDEARTWIDPSSVTECWVKEKERAALSFSPCDSIVSNVSCPSFFPLPLPLCNSRPHNTTGRGSGKTETSKGKLLNG